MVQKDSTNMAATKANSKNSLGLSGSKIDMRKARRILRRSRDSFVHSSRPQKADFLLMETLDYLTLIRTGGISSTVISSDFEGNTLDGNLQYSLFSPENITLITKGKKDITSRLNFIYSHVSKDLSKKYKSAFLPEIIKSKHRSKDEPTLDDHLNFKHDLVYIKTPKGTIYVGESNLRPMEYDKDNYVVTLKNTLEISSSNVNKKKNFKVKSYVNGTKYEIGPQKSININCRGKAKVDISNSYIVSGIANIVQELMTNHGYNELTDKIWDNYLLTEEEFDKKTQYEADIAKELEDKRLERKLAAEKYSKKSDKKSYRVKGNSDDIGISVVMPENHSFSTGYSKNYNDKPKKKGCGFSTGMKTLKNI